jgi:cell wall-associated NlpC family hydrolase
MEFDKYIGVPFEERDCYRFVQYVLEDAAGITIPEFSSIGTKNYRRIFLNFLKEISENWEEVEEPRMFDVIAMAYDPKHPNLVQHFGVYIGGGKILHTLANVGSHTAKLNSPLIKNTIKGIYRWNLT